jgi:hypothetical protein
MRQQTLVFARGSLGVLVRPKPAHAASRRAAPHPERMVIEKLLMPLLSDAEKLAAFGNDL